ncbi:MAG: protocatechuate 3,4-dioxygenase subunit alpha [Rhizobiales bacterium]|nr:protocatechuate 3,4-dioxygenase subunit alpha [Hyphomicrobiales bacterium]
MTGETPSQTVGPFFALGLTAEQYEYPHSSIAGPDLTTPDTEGTRITVTGQVFDGNGEPVTDAMIELWQADAAGRYPGQGSNTGFKSFGRAGTGSDDTASFSFQTIRPGSIGDNHAAHINVALFMRGTLNHLFTRIYFPEDTPDHTRDPVLLAVPPDRRATLIASLEAANVYRFDIHMQGAQETVFFDI